MFLGEVMTGYIDLSRDENFKLEHMNNSCFICGLPRERFSWDCTAFENHVKHEHNMWNYLYLMLHVGNKRDMELSGQEAYVRRCIRSANTGFFPYMQSLSLAEGEAKHGSHGGHGGHGGGGAAMADMNDS